MNIISLPFILLRCLILTIIIEVIVAYLLKIHNKIDLINVTLVNLITNPIVGFVPIYLNLYYGITARNISLIILEILTVFFEGIIYKKNFKYNKINPYLVSLILNVCSLLLNEIVNLILYN